jgi:membrane protein
MAQRTDGDHGRAADAPTEIPPRGWRDVAARTSKEFTRDKVPMMSAAVAFHSLLALVPALVAMVSIYGLVADPDDVDRQVDDWLGSAPTEVRELVASQLASITEDAGSAVGVGVVLGLLVALWSASSGMAHLVEAVNVAYDEEETRSWIARRLLAVALTLGATLFVVVSVGLIAVLPALLDDAGLGSAGRLAAGALRWVGLLVGMMVALTVVYRYAPDRDNPRWRWVTPGAVVATAVWLVASAAFSIYTANFASYNETYGSLGAVVVVMLWLFLTALSVILGAEINAELERQVVTDTTVGPPRSMGERGAQAADTLGETADRLSASLRHHPR